jgi:pilus assembly protein CpaB
MKMKSLILIFIALGCGLVASIGISQVMSQGGKGQKIEMDQILVAKDAIDSGKKLEAALVQFEEWPKQKIPDGALRKMEELDGMFSSYRFFKGEPILQAKISDKPGGVNVIIPPGYRVNNIKVDEDTVIEAITPGDTVDVSVFLDGNGRNGVTKTGVYTILKNVRVFAKGGQTERSVDDKGQEVRARTISLLVKPEQSQELVLAYRLGKISLALRPKDTSEEEDTGEEITTMTDLLSGNAEDASEDVKPAPRLSDLLASGPTPNGPKGPSMDLVTPHGATRFTFPTGGGAPVEQVLNGNGGQAPEPNPGAAAPPQNPPANPQ